jgi:polysaccharide export outer membrane protein
LLSLGCQSAPYVWVQSLPPEPVQAIGGPTTISPGDVVEVRVFGQEAMSSKGQVRVDGTLTLPLVGQFPVAGQKPEDVARALKGRLTPYINSPEVTVVIQESQVSVSVVGEVKAVGIIELKSPATVLQAIAKSGGLTEFADKSSIFVLRTTAGVTRRIRLKYQSLVDGDPLALRFHLKTGDVIVVE